MSLDIELTDEDEGLVFDGNITHNLNTMAKEAGIYQELWKPDELGVKTAGELVNKLEAGLKLLEENQDLFKIVNPSNGWGTYEGLVKFVRDYVTACKKYPNATIWVSR